MKNSDTSDDDEDDFLGENEQHSSSTTAISRTNRIDKILDAFINVSTPKKSSSSNIAAVADFSADELRQLRESLEDGLRHRSQTCLICIETLKRTEAIWSCVSCYTVFHLTCIQSWARHGSNEGQEEEPEHNFRGKAQQGGRWNCPKCRNEYTRGQCPDLYRCFCGQVVNPKSDPWLLPHSCGQTCHRQLSGCQHTCLLLCHPGPCPPCPKTVMVACHCGRVAPTMRRCGQKTWSCGGQCGRSLNCGSHKCKNVCHAGPCKPCDAISRRPCQCGRTTESRPCSEGRFWSCGQICGRELGCGRHRCTKVCHSAGQCPPCVGGDSTNTCPCGKTVYDDDDDQHQQIGGIDSCIDDLRTCGDTCGKLLDCGVHTCVDRCHKGECGECGQLRQKRCRCGLKEKLVQCGKEYLCDLKCKRKRQCGRHTCNRRCCDSGQQQGGCQPCEQVCGRSLQCGKHKCQMPCHRGLCYPCVLTAEVTCRCGMTKIKVPCGAEKRSKPPRCRQLCVIKPDCHHEKRDQHNCHFGDCPPCRQTCRKAFEACEHSCAAVCHSAVMVDVNAEAAKRPATSPLDKHQPKFVLTSLPCPPCAHPVPVTCLGGHVTDRFPCSEARPYNCGRKCGRPSACGNHTCPKLCHAVVSGERAGEGEACQECTESCSLPRPGECTHPCLKQCHPAPCPPCRQMLRKTCHCGLNQMYIPCLEWNSATNDSAKRAETLACGNPCPKQLSSCGHQCSFNCHPGACSGAEECERKVTVRCPCGRRSAKSVCSKVKGCGRLECDQECKAAKEMKKEAKKQSKEEQEETKVEEETTKMANLTTGGPRRRRKQKLRSSDDDEGSAGNFLSRLMSGHHKTTLLIAFCCVGVVILAYILLW